MKFVGGGGVLYCSKLASGPSTTAGSKDPTNDDGTYWTRVSVDDEGNVHKAIEKENITGYKYFHTTSFIKCLGTERGTPPSSTYWRDIIFDDGRDGYYNSASDHNRYGMIGCEVIPTGEVATYLMSYHNATDSDKFAWLRVAVLPNGNPYVRTVSTPLDNPDNNDILTRDWIPKDTRIVHTTGEETINGWKAFANGITVANNFYFKANGPYYHIVNLSLEKDTLPSSGQYSGFVFTDKNNKAYNRTQTWVHTDGTSGWALEAACFDHIGSGSFDIALAIYLDKTASSRVVAVGKTTMFRSDQTGQTTLGGANYRWGTLYTTTNPNVSSDERLKNSIQEFPSNVLDAWGDINWVEFKYNDSVKEKGDSARIHSGMIAQQAKSAFLKHNVDIEKYGFFCWDSWNDEPEIKDNDGNIIKEQRTAGEEFSIRYGEALCMEAAYQRRQNSRTESRFLDLEQRIALLEEKIKQEG